MPSWRCSLLTRIDNPSLTGIAVALADNLRTALPPGLELTREDRVDAIAIESEFVLDAESSAEARHEAEELHRTALRSALRAAPPEVRARTVWLISCRAPVDDLLANGDF